MSTPGRGWTRRRVGERLAGGVVFPLWARREHAGYAGWRREFERSQYLSAGELQELQQQRLTALLRHAVQNCSFYRERLQGAGVDPAAPVEPAAWQGVPLLTKADIQNHGAGLQAEGFPAAARIRNQTGGSTGSPLQFYVDRARFASRMASTHRHNAWAGLQPGDWVGQIWGNRLDLLTTETTWDRLRRHLLYRTLELNSSSIGPEDWRNYVALLRRYRPRFMVAYARAAVRFAEYVREQGIDDLRFQAIITSAEVLSPEHRQTVEEVFRAQVFNRYGCREVSVIASECEAHDGLHVNEEALLVEIVPAAGLEAPWGKIVVTDLLNQSMPLIRYEIGDVGRWQEGTCACGRQLRRLAEVQGRTTDFLEMPGGRAVSGPALTLVVADMAAVRQVQFMQRHNGAVELRVVPGAGYGEATELELRRRLEVYLRGDVPLKVERVDAIASEASGKYRFVVKEDSPVA